MYSCNRIIKQIQAVKVIIGFTHDNQPCVLKDDEPVNPEMRYGLSVLSH